MTVRFSTDTHGRTSPSSFLWEHSQRPEWTPIQNQVDGIVRHALSEGEKFHTLGVLTTATLAGRFTRLGFSALPLGAAGRSSFLSWTLGLGGEVVGYELINRCQIGLIEPIRPMNLWKWQGPGGWGEGLSVSGLQFGLLHGAGLATRGQNIVFQHTLQSSALAAGQRLAGEWGWIPKPEGTTAEILFQAETLNIQLGAVLGLTPLFAPRVDFLQRSLDLMLGSGRLPRAGATARFPFQEGFREPALLGPGASPGSGREKTALDFLKSLNLSMSIHDKNGNEPPKGPPLEGQGGSESLHDQAARAETRWTPYLRTADLSLRQAFHLTLTLVNRWIAEGKEAPLQTQTSELQLLKDRLSDAQSSLARIEGHIQDVDRLRFQLRAAKLEIPEPLTSLAKAMKQTKAGYEKSIRALENDLSPLLEKNGLPWNSYRKILSQAQAAQGRHPEWSLPLLLPFSGLPPSQKDAGKGRDLVLSLGEASPPALVGEGVRREARLGFTMEDWLNPDSWMGDLKSLCTEWMIERTGNYTNREVNEIGRNLQDVPPYFLQQLSFFAKTDPVLAKLLLVRLGLLPKESPLQKDPALEAEMKLKTGEVFVKDEFERLAERVIANYEWMGSAYAPEAFRPLSPAEHAQWNKSLGELPPSLLRTLGNTNLRGASLLYLLNRLGISSLPAPERAELKEE